MLWVLIRIASTSRCNSNEYPQHMPLKEVKKKYTGCNLKTMEFLNCALIEVCAVFRSNTVINTDHILYHYSYVAFNLGDLNISKD